jgi:hypothetical protein
MRDDADTFADPARATQRLHQVESAGTDQHQWASHTVAQIGGVGARRDQDIAGLSLQSLADVLHSIVIAERNRVDLGAAIKLGNDFVE